MGIFCNGYFSSPMYASFCFFPTVDFFSPSVCREGKFLHTSARSQLQSWSIHCYYFFSPAVASDLWVYVYCLIDTKKKTLNAVMLKTNLFSNLFWNIEVLLREIFVDPVLHRTRSTSHQIPFTTRGNPTNLCRGVKGFPLQRDHHNVISLSQPCPLPRRT